MLTTNQPNMLLLMTTLLFTYGLLARLYDESLELQTLIEEAF